MGGQRKLHTKELHDSYSSQSIIRIIKSRRMKWVGHVAQMRRSGTLVGKPGGKRPLGRPRYRWVDNIIMDLKKIRWDGVDCIGLAQDKDNWRALVNAVMNLHVP
jgi:hypothetical protein